MCLKLLASKVWIFAMLNGSTKSLRGLNLRTLDIRGLHLNSPDNQVIGSDVTETVYLTKKNIHPQLLRLNR